MTHEGRQILYRVKMRLSVEWGAAISRLDAEDAAPMLCMKPFEAVAYHDAIYIVDALYHGWPVMNIFRKVEEDASERVRRGNDESR